MSTLNSKPKGHSHKLLVRVIEAYDLPRGDVLSKSDPFVSVKVKGFFHRKRKTPYIANTSAPVWNHEIILRAYRLKDVVQIKVYDHDHLTKNDLLGVVEVPISKYMLNEGQIFDEWIPLMKKRRIFGGLKPGKGQIHLQFLYGATKH